MLLAVIGTPEIIGIVVLIIILFGAKKIPELMRGLGSGVKEFKKAANQDEDKKNDEQENSQNSDK